MNQRRIGQLACVMGLITIGHYGGIGVAVGVFLVGYSLFLQAW